MNRLTRLVFQPTSLKFQIDIPKIANLKKQNTHFTCVIYVPIMGGKYPNFQKNEWKNTHQPRTSDLTKPINGLTWRLELPDMVNSFCGWRMATLLRFSSTNKGRPLKNGGNDKDLSLFSESRKAYLCSVAIC